MVAESDIVAALKKVPGARPGQSLADSGVLAGISLREGKAYVALAVDPREAARLEPMRAAAERAIAALPGISGVVVALTADRPKPAAPPGGARAQTAAIPGVARMIAVASGKGGVGKSTTSANLALALAAEGWRVGLLDADIFGPSVPRLFGLKDQKPKTSGGRIAPLEAFGVKLMSIGFMVDEGQAMIWRGPMVVSALGKMLREVDWGDLDCLLVDMPPGTGDVQLSLAQQAPLSGAVIVSTPQDLALIDARRAVAMFGQVATPVLGLIENMSYFLCPHCGGRTDIFGHGGARSEAAAIGAPFLGEVPLAMALRETSDAGAPIVASDPASLYAAAYREIAGALKAALDGAPRRAPPKIVFE